MSELLTITDELAFVLNDANTKFQTLTDSLSFDDTTIDLALQPVLSDTLTMSATIAFEKEFSLFDSFAITEDYPRITGLLFGFESLTESMSMSDSTITIVIPELVITEASENILTEAGHGLEIE